MGNFNIDVGNEESERYFTCNIPLVLQWSNDLYFNDCGLSLESR